NRVEGLVYKTGRRPELRTTRSPYTSIPRHTATYPRFTPWQSRISVSWLWTAPPSSQKRTIKCEEEARSQRDHGRQRRPVLVFAVTEWAAVQDALYLLVLVDGHVPEADVRHVHPLGELVCVLVHVFQVVVEICVLGDPLRQPHTFA